MQKISSDKAKYLRDNYKTLSHKQLSEATGLPWKSISEWLRKRKLYKIRRYGDTENYMINNFNVDSLKEFIPDKSKNALKIKKCRMKAQK